MPVRVVIVTLLILLGFSLSVGAAVNPVHNISCKRCHLAGYSFTDLAEDNICLSCHDITPTAYNSPLRGVIQTAPGFASGDASNAFGSNPAPNYQTSHNWAALSPNPAAGAVEPDATTYPNFYGRYGTSAGMVTCSRCHDPHGDYDTNPKLMQLQGDNITPMTPDDMCLACHTPWDQADNHGWLTHPIVDNYNASVIAEPDKYNPTLSNKDNAEIKLVNGGVTCTSCHGVHFVDSDASTVDGQTATINPSDGKLLLGDGPEQTDKSSLCQTCHTYLEHGDGGGEKVGCLVCHSGHSYDPTAPNYFVLRKSASTTTFNSVNGLDYSSPDVLDAGLKYTFWNDLTDGSAEGYCEKCHGDAKDIGAGAGSYHVASAVCTNCHQHGHTSGTFAAACDVCHGFPPGPLAAAPDDTGSLTAGAHIEHVDNFGYSCDACHVDSVGSGPTHNNGDHRITLGFAPFGGLQQGGSYDGQTTAQYNTTSTAPPTTVTNTGTKQCSNIYCHGNYPGSGENATPVWDDAASAPCGSCHKAKNNDVLTSGTHAMHAGDGAIDIFGAVTNQKNIACTVCHEDIIDGAGPDSYTIENPAKHVNNAVDLKFDTTDARLTGIESYSIASGSQPATDGDTGAGNRDYGTCSTVYCHSNVQPDGGVGPPDVYTSPANLKWGSPTGCFGCHAGEAGAPASYGNIVSRHTLRMTDPATATGSHYEHLGSSTSEGRCELCHNWFYPSNTNMSQCGQCHFSHDGIRSLHVDGNVDILFNQYAVFPYGWKSAPFDTVANSTATYNGTPAPGDGYGSCSNTYCHSDGTAIRTGDGNHTNTTPQWGSPAAGCNICHGNSTYADWRQGMPDYANGSPKENSHVEHINQSEIDNCSFCHPDTTLDGLNINKSIAHANAYYEARFERDTDFSGGLNKFANRDVKFRYQGNNDTIPEYNQSASGNCSAITCHGYPDYLVFSQSQDYTPVKSNVFWGEYVTCGECHLREASAGTVGQGDLDSYQYGDGLHGSIDNDQWLYSGHGKTSGTYDVSGNPAANFSGAANCTEWLDNFWDDVNFPSEEERCDECLYCHTDSAAHDDGSNPFRLSNNNILGNGWNDTCLVCHGTGSTGYDPDGAGTMTSVNRTTSTVVDKYHFGYKHGADNDGGSLCWDCHDPHGDRIAGDGNIYMIHEQVTVEKLDEYGTPDLTVPQIGRPVFTDNQTGSDYASVNPAPYNGICNVCHAIPASGGPDHYSWQHGDGHNIGQKCTDCHAHSGNTTVDGGAFDHSGGADCIECHGHDAGTNFDPDMSVPFSAGATPSPGNGSYQSHSTHTETDTDDAKGPGLYCDSCHDINNFPFFKSGTDSDSDGRYSLSETDICNACHSSGGAFDGANDSAVGAKGNWSSGVYTGSTLTAGKEKWCVTCHDTGTSVVKGRQAPDVAGDNINYGYYMSGHGSDLAIQECSACHDPGMAHIDGVRTYVAASDNYKAGYRLKDVAGGDPFDIPYLPDPCEYKQAPTDFELCFQCHSEQSLLNDTRASGYQSCSSNPYDNAASITTSFRTTPNRNIHADHLIGVSGWQFFFGVKLAKWDSDRNGGFDSGVSCSTCHNPHGAKRNAVVEPTVRMTVPGLDIQWGNDGADYGEVGPAGNVGNVCYSACHAPNGGKYYRTHPVPELDSITATDTNPTDPAAAETGFTNSTSVEVTLTPGAGFTPTEMRLAEDITFSVNDTGWIPYSSPYIYTLTSSEGAKKVWVKIKDATTTSGARGDTIVLDTTDPSVSVIALTAPNGTETWIQDSLRNITWYDNQLNDANLKLSPVSLAYSLDSGATFPNSIASDEPNDGTYQWSVAPEESSAVQVRLTATDKAGNQASDSSDADFTIQPAGAAVLSTITVSDNNNFDPAAAEAGYTNNQSVSVSLNVNNHPTQMILAEDSGFSANSTGWISFSSNYTYNLSAGDGSKTVYAKVRNILGESGSQNDSIVLDTVDPAILATTLTAPNGNADPKLAEFWTMGSSQTITWNSGDISDINLKAAPIFIKRSWNSGLSYPVSIANDEANDGSYSWSVSASTSTTARIRVAARDKAGNEGTDASDNNFNISPPYIVTNTNDSGAGSLSQVMTDIVAGGGNSPIWFNIPTTDPNFTNGVAVISPTTDLPAITQSDIIFEGGSQTTLQGDTNPNGPEVRINKAGTSTTGLSISSDSVYVENLQITGFTFGVSSSGSDTSMENNQLGFSSDTSGYTSLPNAQNASLSGSYPNVYNQNVFGCATSAGLVLSDSSDAYVDGNTFGLYPDGTACPTTGSSAILVSSAATDAWLTNNIISGSTYGINLGGSSANTVIRGNQIGVYYSGGSWFNVVSPANAGVYLNTTGGGNVIGGASVATSDSNLRNSNVIKPSASISANSAGGIYIYDAADYTTKIYGNFIGTNPEEDEAFSGGRGIMVRYLWGVTIGGGEADEAGNVIANMTAAGVELYNSSARYVDIRRNSFYDNGNDVDDDAIFLDDGNSSITRPVITSATTSTVSVSGLSGGDGGTQAGDIVEVYIADFGGTEYGEGKTYISSGVVAFGETTLDVDISGAGLSPGDWLTVTRTNHYTTTPVYQTSAFSKHYRIPGPSVPTLDWTGEANFTTDGVDPDSDLSGSDFTFRVEYSDADDDPPQTIEAWVDTDNSGSYGANEKFVMTEVNAGDTIYTDGKLYTLTLPVGKVLDGLHDYRFYASDGASDATGAPTNNTTLTVTSCSNDLSVDPLGTYFEAENFLATIPQGTSTFVQETSVAGYNGSAYLRGNGTNTTTLPPSEEGKMYELNFPTTGNYRVWLRARSDNSSSDSQFIGLDSNRTGYLFTGYVHNVWRWISSTQAGQPGTGSAYINIGTSGDHTFNIWFRENNYKVDAIYLTQGTEIPDTDIFLPAGAAKVIDTSVCAP